MITITLKLNLGLHKEGRRTIKGIGVFAQMVKQYD
jgi:hypothetical protein